MNTYEKAIKWIYNNTVCENGGIAVSNKNKVIYPEVTGYYIPSLLEAGETELAISFAKKLCEIQREDGSWYDPGNTNPFIFDGGQILKGLVAIRKILPEVDMNIIKGIDWIFLQQNEQGRLVQPNEKLWGGDDTHCNDLIHIYCISPILEYARETHNEEYERKAIKALNYYIENNYERITHYTLFSHFYAYVIEGLIDCGREDIAREAMKNFEKYRRSNGAICAYNDVEWVCSTAMFQFAIIWYKLGEKSKADLTYNYACSLQNLSGGWFGSYGYTKVEAVINRIQTKLGCVKRIQYMRKIEISWAVKFYLDATYYKNLLK